MKAQAVLIDPPWWYGDRCAWSEQKNAPTKFGGGAWDTYPLMKDKELLEIAPFINQITAKNSSLHLWATGPRLDFCIEFLRACGFTYVTVEYVWVKTILHAPRLYMKHKLTFAQLSKRIVFKGTGSYSMSNAEFILLGRKGRIGKYTKPNKPAQVVLAPHPRYPKDYPGLKPDGTPLAGKIVHSRKPAVFRDLIEAARGPVAKLEIFSREHTPGWMSLGHGVNNGADIKDALRWFSVL